MISFYEFYESRWRISLGQRRNVAQRNAELDIWWEFFYLWNTRSLGALRAPTSSWRLFGPLDFVLRALRALRPCDPMGVPWAWRSSSSSSSSRTRTGVLWGWDEGKGGRGKGGQSVVTLRKYWTYWKLRWVSHLFQVCWAWIHMDIVDLLSEQCSPTLYFFSQFSFDPSVTHKIITIKSLFGHHHVDSILYVYILYLVC